MCTHCSARRRGEEVRGSGTATALAGPPLPSPSFPSPRPLRAAHPPPRPLPPPRRRPSGGARAAGPGPRLPHAWHRGPARQLSARGGGTSRGAARPGPTRGARGGGGSRAPAVRALRGGERRAEPRAGPCPYCAGGRRRARAGGRPPAPRRPRAGPGTPRDWARAAPGPPWRRACSCLLVAFPVSFGGGGGERASETRDSRTPHVILGTFRRPHGGSVSPCSLSDRAPRRPARMPAPPAPARRAPRRRRPPACRPPGPAAPRPPPAGPAQSRRAVRSGAERGRGGGAPREAAAGLAPRSKSPGRLSGSRPRGGPERGTGPPSPGRLRLRARGAPLARPQPFCCPSAARAVVVCWQMVFVVLGCGAAVRHSGELSVPALSGSAEVSSRCLQATGPTRASCSRPVSLLAHCFTEVRIENTHL